VANRPFAIVSYRLPRESRILLVTSEALRFAAILFGSNSSSPGLIFLPSRAEEEIPEEENFF